MGMSGRAVMIGLLLGGCGGNPPAGDSTAPRQPSGNTPAANSSAWDLQSSGEGAALVRLAADGTPTVRLFCPRGANRLVVNVTGFRPIGSEERMSVGSDAGTVALVADSRGDAGRGGVTGTGAVPEDLKSLVTGPLSVSYGTQTSGPHPVAADALTAPFIRACDEGPAKARQAAATPTAATSPCLVQDGRLLSARPVRAIGTEPFWGARIIGRCVTYSHPDDQKGTRIWTRINDGPDGSVFVGALGGKPFVLRLRGSMQCSDGMSDNKYSIAVWLTVNGEGRRGCAELL